MNQRFDVVIVGGGIIGLCAAIAMRQRGYSVVVLDAGILAVESIVESLRVYAINQASQALLTTCGVWPLLDQTQISPYEHMHVWDAQNDSKIDFDARMIGEPSLGVIVEESVLKKALLQRILDLEGILVSSIHVDRVIPSESSMMVYAGPLTWEGDLLIIADGAKSKTRDYLNVPMSYHPYHQTAIVATVGVEKAHEKTAYQVFNPDGPLAFLPLVDENQCSIVWSTSTKRAKALMECEAAEFSSHLKRAFSEKLGEVTCLSERVQFPLVMQHAKQYQGKRWLLMGDAAHTIHPLAGLGLNVGLADLATWIDLLDRNDCPIYANKLLGQYQRKRKSDVWQIIALMSGLKTLFGYTSMPIVALRGLGLGVFDKLAGLKRLLIEGAGGV